MELNYFATQKDSNAQRPSPVLLDAPIFFLVIIHQNVITSCSGETTDVYLVTNNLTDFNPAHFLQSTVIFHPIKKRRTEPIPTLHPFLDNPFIVCTS